MSKAELAALGTPAGAGIPVYIDVPTSPRLSFGMVNGQCVLTWPLSSTGFTLQSTTDLASGAWTAVSGVVSNSVVVPATTGKVFFRLVK